MLIDSQNQFSNNQKITTAVASDNVVKMSDGFLNEVAFKLLLMLNSPHLQHWYLQHLLPLI